MTEVAVITGASSGIGEATARLLATRPETSIVLVARRRQRLQQLARALGPQATHVAVDVTTADAPQQIAEHLSQQHAGRVTLLVNNAGASWRATFADGGYDNVRRTMEINFNAVVRVTEALLPLLRASSPATIINVASTASRVARPGAGAYSASKFALAGWSDALYLEERPHGIHVGLVLPGFIATEGFPAAELRQRRLTRWIVSDSANAAQAIIDTALNREAERYVPRPYALAAAARVLAPRLLRRLQTSDKAALLTTRTSPDQ